MTMLRFPAVRAPRPSRLVGFTLVEMLVVISIGAILMSLLMPALGRVRERARRAQCLSNTHQQALALISYATDHGGAYPIRNSESYKLHRNGAYQGLGLLYPDYVDDPRIFYCPSFSNEPNSFSGVYGWERNYPTVRTHPNIGINCNYIALHHAPAGSTDVSVLNYVRGRPSCTPLTSDFFSLGYGRFGHKTGYNVSYADGHASWYNDREEKVIQLTTGHGSRDTIITQIWLNTFGCHP